LNTALASTWRRETASHAPCQASNVRASSPRAPAAGKWRRDRVDTDSLASLNRPHMPCGVTHARSARLRRYARHSSTDSLDTPRVVAAAPGRECTCRSSCTDCRSRRCPCSPQGHRR
jgi:hypothetical protein